MIGIRSGVGKWKTACERIDERKAVIARVTFFRHGAFTFNRERISYYTNWFISFKAFAWVLDGRGVKYKKNI